MNFKQSFLYRQKYLLTLSFRNVRQELAILANINHVNIIRFYGVSTSPFAMLLELAPMGALDDRYKEYRRLGKRINPFILQKTLAQVTLHHHDINKLDVISLFLTLSY